MTISKVLKFSAPWCNPCKSLSQVIKNAKVDILVEEVDIDTNTEAKHQYRITGVPTLIAFDENDVEIKRKSGMMTVPQFEAFCK